jgi:chromosome segregation ATPase
MTPLFFLSLLVGATNVAETPVAKVVRLLTDMKDRLESEAKADAELYDQLSCWCETNKRDKDAATEMAEKQITSLTADIEELAAKSAELKANIARLQKEVGENTAALNTATAIREKEHSEFSASESELLASASSVTDAVNTLSKHHSAFLQVSSSSSVVSGLQGALKRAENLAPSQRKLLSAFLQQPAGYNSYNSASGEIFGILKQMKETFESNLSAEARDEQNAQAEFDELKAAKTREIQAAKAAIVDKTQSLAETDESHAHAKHDLSKTRDALSADQKFLIDLNQRCTNGDAEFAERSKMRSTEIAAVSEAMAMLTDDSARDLFSTTLSFFEKQSTNARAKAAARVLQAAGAKTGNTALLALAATAGLDAFTKVNAAIDEMVTALKTEMKDEVKHQRYCVAELDKNEKGQAEKKSRIADLSANIDENTATVATLTKEIKALQDQVVEMNVQIKRASEDRKKENQEFQQVIADQRATQNILTKVYARLEKVYAAPSLVQQKQTPGAAAPPPPAGFKAYSQDEGAGGVLSLIQQIIAESSTLEKEALNAEQNAQTDYQRFVGDSSKSIGAANRSIAAKADEKAELEGSIVQDTADRKANMANLESLGTFNGQLHLSCDFVLNNFEARQEARGQEIDALGQAKAILSGADFQ